MIKKTVSKTIRELFEQDQADRFSKKLMQYAFKRRWAIIQARDAQRIHEVSKFLSYQNLKAIDCFRAGIIFQHGTTLDHIRKARKLALKGSRLGHSASKWLYAATTDRLLMFQGKKQKFGTQFQKNSQGLWEIYPIDPRTTDHERSLYKVKTLQGIKSVLLKLNTSRLKSSHAIGLTYKR